MAYCPKCGVRLPKEEGMRFCPSCGTPIPRAILERLFPQAISLEKRVLVILITLMICIFVTALGASSRVSIEEAQAIEQEMSELRVTVRTSGPLFIFGWNFIRAILMFIPVAGSGWGLYVLYNTGRVIAGFGMLWRINPLLLFASLFLFPFTWMEYIVYSLAISESIILTYSIIKRVLKRELEALLITIVVCAIVLLMAAWVEFLLAF